VKRSSIKSVLLIGWYGYNNLGDDLLFEIITKDLKRVYDKIYFPCNSKCDLFNKDEVLKPLKLSGRLQLFTLLFYIFRCDCLVLGGGTYLRDIISNKVLTSKLILIYIAQKLNKKTIIWGGGLGPFYFNKKSNLLKSVLSNFNYVLLRDKTSESTFKTITGKECTLVPDPVYLLYNNITKYQKCIKLQNKKLTIGLSLREWGTELGHRDDIQYKNFILIFQKFLNNLKKEYDVKVFCFIFQNTSNDFLSSDENVYNDLFSNNDYFEYKYITFNNDMPSFLKSMGSINCLIGMRLHSIIIASCFNIPILGISYDIKVESLMNDLGIQSSCIKYDRIDFSEINNKFKLIFNQNYSKYIKDKINSLNAFQELINKL
jgi:L-malate glycosyltransferase